MPVAAEPRHMSHSWSSSVVYLVTKKTASCASGYFFVLGIEMDIGGIVVENQLHFLRHQP